MTGIRIVAWLGLVAACAGAGAAELVAPAADTPLAADDAPGEHWQYHEKWLRAQQRGLLPASKGAAPATECRPPINADRSTVRPTPGRCPARGTRVRT